MSAGWQLLARPYSVQEGIGLFVVSVLVWASCLVIFAAGPWFALHAMGRRNVVAAAILGAALAFVAAGLVNTVLFNFPPAPDGVLTAPDGVVTYAHGQLTGRGWQVIAERTAPMLIIGAIVGAVVWRVAYRKAES